jgi:hypothetical protein
VQMLGVMDCVLGIVLTGTLVGPGMMHGVHMDG